eukprot:scaffold16068_cov113-Isochrysis_galbana.AAC.8
MAVPIPRGAALRERPSCGPGSREAGPRALRAHCRTAAHFSGQEILCTRARGTPRVAGWGRSARKRKARGA